MKTLFALSTLALGIIWIRRRRDHRRLVRAAGEVGGWWEEALPG